MLKILYVHVCLSCGECWHSHLDHYVDLVDVSQEGKQAAAVVTHFLQKWPKYSSGSSQVALSTMVCPAVILALKLVHICTPLRSFQHCR